MPDTKIRKHLTVITFDPILPDLSQSPFILKKVEKAKAFIAKHGLPKDDKPTKKVK